jgi:hypothetical protein
MKPSCILIAILEWLTLLIHQYRFCMAFIQCDHYVVTSNPLEFLRVREVGINKVQATVSTS